ncbi:acyl-CoA dehydrogenase family protein [Paracoccus sp. J55]|uniref:acyl-CoA dehydrogenase family protein n=1 Tax=Paracoccus sp. J55 TaxID=935849 RepID=UPI00048B1D3B|nr:acyl-CoA dehydrogenase family protein [Paracoccus sp. J55]
MDLFPDTDESQIIDAAADFLRQEWPSERLHGLIGFEFSSDGRTSFADLGWFGIALPEDQGGVGMTAVEEVLFHREMGRYLGPFGVLAIGLAARVAAAAGLPGLRDELIAGRHAVALAVPAGFDAPQEKWRLFEFVGAGFALRIEPEGAALLSLSGIETVPVPCLDKSVPMALADLRNADVVAQISGPDIARRARLGAAAQLSGIADAVTQRINEYAKVRETFGRAIGSYQAVRHEIANMAVRSEVARAQLYYAAISERDGRDDAALQIDAAKLLANEAAVENCDWNIQLHGGIATTAEHDAHFFFKRARLMALLFGGDHLLKQRIREAQVAE